MPQIGLPSAEEREQQVNAQLMDYEKDADDDDEGRVEGEEPEPQDNTDSTSTEAGVARPRQENESQTDLAAEAAVQVKHAPNPRLLLVSHLFKDEYLSTAKRQMTLSITRIDENSPMDHTIPKVMQAVRTIDLSFHIHRGCWKFQGCSGGGPYYVRSPLEKAQDLIFNLLCQTSKPKFWIRVCIISPYLVDERCGSCKWNLLDMQRLLTRTFGLESLVIRNSSSHRDSGSVILKFNRETKQLEEVGPSDPENATDVDFPEDLDEEGREGGEGV